MASVEYPSPQPVLELPFRRDARVGSVSVHYGVTADPERLGFPSAALGYDRDRFVGFPVMRASITFEADTYFACFGWIQLVTTTNDATGESVTVNDPPPFAEGLENPMAAFGYSPTLFDAPANPDHPDGDWVAESFLVAIPDIARSRRLTALTGFRWGYRLKGGIPSPLPAEPVGPDRWTAHHDQLAAQYPSWDFLDAWQ